MSPISRLEKQLIHAVETSTLREQLKELNQDIDTLTDGEHSRLQEATKAIEQLDAENQAELNRLQERLSGRLDNQRFKLTLAFPDRYLKAFELEVAPADVPQIVRELKLLGYQWDSPMEDRYWTHYARFHRKAQFRSIRPSEFSLQMRWQPRRPWIGRWGRFLTPSVEDLSSVPLPEWLWPGYGLVRLARSLYKPPRLPIDLGPFLGTPDGLIPELLQFAGMSRDTHLIDLGSGDGRVLIAASQKYGCSAKGYETDIRLHQFAQQAIRAAKLDTQIQLESSDAKKANIATADVVFLFLPASTAKDLLKPTLSRMKKGTVLVSHEQEATNFAVEPQERRAIILRDGITVANKWIAPGGAAE